MTTDTPLTDAAGLLGFVETPRTDAVVASKCSDGSLVGELLTISRKLERELATQSLILNRYREALQRIATADYRGNRPSECDIAQEALRGH